MKYIRKFNESINSELQDFCETHLAYLIDEGFLIDVSNQDEYTQDAIRFTKTNLGTDIYNNPPDLFKWDDIKDHFIPFIHMLSKQYTITNIKFWIEDELNNSVKKYYDYDYDLSQVLEDRIIDTRSLSKIVQISIFI